MPRRRVIKKVNDIDEKYLDKIDIVFSLTAHEKPLFVSKVIDNLNKYSKNYKVFIIINGSKDIRRETVKKDYNNVMFNPNYKKRRKYFYDILGAHVDNYILLKEKDIKYKRLILMASNCLLFKQLDIKDFVYVDKNR